jgi:hypothetical protein
MSLPPDDDQRLVLRRAIEALQEPAKQTLSGEFTLLHGGCNNRVYRVDADPEPVVLKWYFSHSDDPRDRLAAEYAFCDCCWQLGLTQTPRPLAMNAAARLALYSFIPGRRLTSEEVAPARVAEAAAFVAAVNRGRDHPAAQRLPVAAEACFSPAQHVDCVERRVHRLCHLDAADDLHAAAQELVRRELVPAWASIRRHVLCQFPQAAASLPGDQRCVSPSDFGFHNALWEAGQLRFIDFEYSGWDDPAKLICDFFCQIERPVPLEHWEALVVPLEEALSCDSGLRQRAAALLPVYRVKWCAIVLNEFLPEHRARRSFSGILTGDEHLERQLSKARELVATLSR